ncbi:MAG: hypothetical protein HY308_09255 [Gammaproteobacteria bacterium]|nr:hypothetical protein [Gammaproteobacteria bacterium]
MNVFSSIFGIAMTGIVVSPGVVFADDTATTSDTPANHVQPMQGNDAAVSAGADDMLRIAPHNTKVLFENDRVRVLETRTKPGEKLPMHSHPPRVNYFLNPLQERITYQGKQPQEYSWKAGDVAFSEAVTLEVANIGTTEGRNIVVELKETASNTAANHAQHMHDNDATVPTMVGQDAFGAIQEIVRLLEADPKTDWSKVNIEALREHLIDMNEIALRAKAITHNVDGGLQIDVIGSGRTLAAIRRVMPAHASQMNGLPNWQATTKPLPSGVRLVVTTSNPDDVSHLRGLGFMGLMVSGAHHQLHHLALAKGEHAH